MLHCTELCEDLHVIGQGVVGLYKHALLCYQYLDSIEGLLTSFIKMRVCATRTYS